MCLKGNLYSSGQKCNIYDSYIEGRSGPVCPSVKAVVPCTRALDQYPRNSEGRACTADIPVHTLPTLPIIH